MKRWRRGTLLIAAALAVAAAACGVRSGTPDKPAGDQTVLRVEPFSSRVSCGSRDISVSIYLDDLERRPSSLDASVAAGLTGFEFPLRYDPKVLQIGPPESIQPNAALSDADDDGDGVARTFLPVSNINDGEGWAVLGAASYNPASDGSAEANAEEGLDPVARGGPVLLASVHFQSVGEGTSAVTIEPVEIIPGRPAQGIDLYGPSGIAPVYKPVTVKGTSITVSGGDCSGVAVSTPRPTPLPSSTPYVEPTRHIPTPQYLTPTPAAQGGRSDCPSDWNAYGDPDGYFSICYPGGWSAITAPPEAYLGTVLSIQSPPAMDETAQVLLTIYWEERSAFYEGTGVDRCHAVTHWRNVMETTISLGEKDVTACVGDASDYGHPNPDGSVSLRGTFAEIELGPEKGYVVLFLIEADRGDSNVDEAASSILSSVRLAQ